MNALVALTCVITMQLVPILRGVTCALATLDIKAMGFLAQVRLYIYFPIRVYYLIVVQNFMHTF